MIINAKGNLTDLSTNTNPDSKYSLIYSGACVLTPEIFTKGMAKVNSDEYGLPQTLCQFTNEKIIKVFITEKWFQISFLDDIKIAEKSF
jgi:hypothetical protein